jgi:hypothetical protein
VFVAATMPLEGGTTVGSLLERNFPAAVWVSGPRLHRGQAAVEHGWVAVESPGAPSRHEALKVSQRCCCWRLLGTEGECRRRGPCPFFVSILTPAVSCCSRGDLRPAAVQL